MAPAADPLSHAQPRDLPVFDQSRIRAKEIASLTWDMVTDAEGSLGSALHLRDEASKGSSGRVIPLNKDLRTALQKLHDKRGSSPYVITTERAERHQLLQSSTSSLNGIR